MFNHLLDADIYILFVTRAHECGEEFKILIFPSFFVIFLRITSDGYHRVSFNTDKYVSIVVLHIVDMVSV